MSEQHSGPHESFLDLFPYPEDWQALQGGKPRVFRKAQRPDTKWIVLHVYDEHPEPEARFVSGAIVDTVPPKQIQLSRKGIVRLDTETDRKISRDIVIPSFMDRNVHGDICSQQSSALGGEAYPTIKSQPKYEELIAQLGENGYEELQFGVNETNFTLKPLPQIRPPRPLNP